MEKILIPHSGPIAGLSEEEMYARVLASDAASNGRFFFGVITTGIYCLPSCTARKPLPANIRFFATREDAGHAGLRPCRRCHPDDFARGLDPAVEAVRLLADEVRAAPGRFPHVQSLVRRSGYGVTRLFELFHENLGCTPAAFLLQTRLEAARRLLRDGDQPILDVALAVGFHSASAFHHRFKQATGMTPAAFRHQCKEPLT